MQAIVKSTPTYGISVEDMPEPAIGPGDVRVEVRAAAICGADLKLYKWDPQVVAKWARLRDMELPHIIGHEIAGTVVETGKDVTGIQVGDRIAAETHFPCGACALCQSDRIHLCRQRRILGFDTPGGFARYVVLPECCAIKLPECLSFEAGALCEPFGVAAHAIQQAELSAVESAWNIGCGPIGLFIIQLLAMAGVEKILATDTQPQRLDWARKLGAVPVPSGPEIVEQIIDMTGSDGAELVFEVVGSPTTVQQALAAVAPAGRVLLVGTFGGTTPLDIATDIIYRETTVRGVYGRHMFDTWQWIHELLSSGSIELESCISNRYRFSEATEGFEAALRGDGFKTVLIPDN